MPGGIPNEVHLDPHRRRWVRRPVDLEAFCRAVRPGGAGPWHVRVLDLSDGGCGLASPQTVPPGTVLEIGMFSKGIRLSDLIESRVAWTSRGTDGLWRLGCEFLRELTPRERASLL